jgi:hypothetical protein
LYTYGDTTLINCWFLDNSGSNAGGFYNLGNSSATNCLFSGNEATTRHGGGIYNNTNGILTLTNCTVIGNRAFSLGGGISDEGISVTLNNCILWDNSDRDIDGTGVTAQIFADGDSPVIANFSCIQGWSGSPGGIGNTGENPFLVDADGPDDLYGTEDDDPRLGDGSPCIDAGDNAALPPDDLDVDGDGNTFEPMPFDLDGNARFVDDPFTVDTGEGTSPIVDMGAYEYGDDCNENGLPDDLDIAEGTSADCAGNGIPDECEPDCNGNTLADSCDIATGTGQDCNQNGIPDACDIAVGRSGDCDNSEIPDECEPSEDCNSNGIVDKCDIGNGVSQDCNLTLVPDECELSANDCNTNAVPDDCELVGNDCNDNSIPDECEPDCNGNSAPDSCDITAGTSEDCTGNAIPDECEPDCNGNGMADTCDLADETSQDVNLDGIPDECALGPISAVSPNNARKNRYISINPNNSLASVALQVELASMQRCNGDLSRTCNVDGGCPNVCDNDTTTQCVDAGPCGGGACVRTSPCVEHPHVGMTLGWLGVPFQVPDGCDPLPCGAEDWIARVEADPVYRVWTEDLLHVGDCEIVSVATYELRATADGIIFSDPLVIGTIRKPDIRHYGDIAGPVDGETGEYTPSDGFVSVVDVQAFLLTVKNYPDGSPYVHRTWADLHGLDSGNAPNYIPNVSDLQRILFAFEGRMYTQTPQQLDPGDCP